MMLFIGADHRGHNLKSKVKSQKSKVFKDYKLVDLGAFEYDVNDDYPDFAKKVCQKVIENPGSFGILICGTGAGMSITANKFAGIRAALVFDEKQAKLAREHNDANVLCLPADFLSKNQARKLIKIFLETKFSGQKRHQRRIEKIKKIERRQFYDKSWD